MLYLSDTQTDKLAHQQLPEIPRKKTNIMNIFNKEMDGNEITVSELAVIYEAERKSKSLTKIPNNYYRAGAQCIARLKERYLAEFSKNPDSKSTEMAKRELDRAKNDMASTVRLRAVKILKRSIEHYSNYDPEFVALLTNEEKSFLEGIMAAIAHFVVNYWVWDSTSTKEKAVTDVQKNVETQQPLPQSMSQSPVPQETPKRDNVLVMCEENISIAMDSQDLFLSRGDVVTLPEKIARILIKQKKVSRIYPI
jgi:DNA replication initiation complex subunit (GINS family)